MDKIAEKLKTYIDTHPIDLGDSDWGRFGEEALEFGENGFGYSIIKFDYF